MTRLSIIGHLGPAQKNPLTIPNEQTLIFSRTGKEVMTMARKVTSKPVASKASDLLKDGRTGKKTKSVAGSALSQREKRKR